MWRSSLSFLLTRPSRDVTSFRLIDKNNNILFLLTRPSRDVTYVGVVGVVQYLYFYSHVPRGT